MYRRNFRLLNHKLKPFEPHNTMEFIAFSALGDNEQFFTTLEGLGIKLKGRLSFPDHWDYKGFTPKEDEFYLTTLKDFVKLRPLPNIFVLDFEVDVPGLEEFVKDVIFRKDCSGCG
jgi:Tetraacyldisaccharide-1-P 4'-kinase